MCLRQEECPVYTETFAFLVICITARHANTHTLTLSFALFLFHTRTHARTPKYPLHKTELFHLFSFRMVHINREHHANFFIAATLIYFLIEMLAPERERQREIHVQFPGGDQATTVKSY